MRNSIKRNIKISISLSSLTLASIYCLNKFIDIRATAKNILTCESGRFFDWRYGNVYYTKSGHGSPVLLVHDLTPESSSYEWNRIVKKISKKHTVYTIDLLGCGRSDKPNFTYTNFMYVQLITDFIKKIIGEKTDIIVSGSSVSFVIMACFMNSNCFNKIIFVNPVDIQYLKHLPTKLKHTSKMLLNLPIIGTLIYHIEMMKRNISMRLSHGFYKSHMVSSQLQDVYYESAHLENSHGRFLLSSICNYYTNVNIETALKELNQSLYIIESQNCPNAVSIVNGYTQLNPSIETIFISESKQFPQLEIPEKFFKYLEVFLQSK